MTVILVVAFLLCWTPYTIAMFVHFLKTSSSFRFFQIYILFPISHSNKFRPISPLLSKFLYAFAVFNSAISPYLVGVFSRKVIAIFALLYSFVVWIFFFQHSSRSPAIVVFLRSNNNPDHGNHFMRAWLRCK